MKPISELLRSLAAGEISVADAEQSLASREIEAIDGATVDRGRRARCGFGEVIYGEGKSAELIVRVAEKLLELSPSVLVTRLAADVFAEIQVPEWRMHYAPQARTLRIAREDQSLAVVEESSTAIRPIAVITAGSTDAAVAEEVAETLTWMRVPFRMLTDIGVAGPQRLLASLPSLEGCAAAVVVAGMEGALPSVVAGHVPYPVIAVPTSVGYGASLGGITALLSMLTSCASNVSVVNIDAGFKGGYVAGLIASGQQVRSQAESE